MRLTMKKKKIKEIPPYGSLAVVAILSLLGALPKIPDTIRFHRFKTAWAAAAPADKVSVLIKYREAKLAEKLPRLSRDQLIAMLGAPDISYGITNVQYKWEQYYLNIDYHEDGHVRSWQSHLPDDGSWYN